jgi:hypothetical protein
MLAPSSPLKNLSAELLQWYTPEAQAYMVPRGYANRQIKITGSTSGEVHMRHRGKLVGDSSRIWPEGDHNKWRWVPNKAPAS